MSPLAYPPLIHIPLSLSDVRVFPRAMDNQSIEAWVHDSKIGPSFSQLGRSYISYPGSMVPLIFLVLTLMLNATAIITAYASRKKVTPILHHRRARQRSPSGTSHRRSRIIIGTGHNNRLSMYSAKTARSDGLSGGKRQSALPIAPYDSIPLPSTIIAISDGSHLEPPNQQQSKRDYTNHRVSFYAQPPPPPALTSDTSSRPSRFSMLSVATSPPVLETADIPKRGRSRSLSRSLRRQSWFTISGTAAPKEIMYVRPRRSPGTFLVASAEEFDDEDDWWEDEEVWGDVEVLGDKDELEEEYTRMQNAPNNRHSYHGITRLQQQGSSSDQRNSMSHKSALHALNPDAIATAEDGPYHELLARNRQIQASDEYRRRTWHIQEDPPDKSSDSDETTDVDDMDWNDLW